MSEVAAETNGDTKMEVVTNGGGETGGEEGDKSIMAMIAAGDFDAEGEAGKDDQAVKEIAQKVARPAPVILVIMATMNHSLKSNLNLPSLLFHSASLLLSPPPHFLKCIFNFPSVEDQIHSFTACRPILSKLPDAYSAQYKNIFGTLEDQKETIRIFLVIDKTRHHVKKYHLSPGSEKCQDPCTFGFGPTGAA